MIVEENKNSRVRLCHVFVSRMCGLYNGNKLLVFWVFLRVSFSKCFIKMLALQKSPLSLLKFVHKIGCLEEVSSCQAMLY